MKAEQVITKLAAEMAEQINQNKSPEGYTIICTYRELRHMVSEAIPADADKDDAVNEFFEQMVYTHNLFIEVSEFDDVVLDEREEV